MRRKETSELVDDGGQRGQPPLIGQNSEEVLHNLGRTNAFGQHRRRTGMLLTADDRAAQQRSPPPITGDRGSSTPREFSKIPVLRGNRPAIVTEWPGAVSVIA